MLARRLRPLSEEECYARCYGDFDDTVRIVRTPPRRRSFESGEELRRLFEDRLDARDPAAPVEDEAA